MGYLLCYFLIVLTGSPSFPVRDWATQALCFLQGHGGIPSQVLTAGLDSQDPEIRARAQMVQGAPYHRHAQPQTTMRFSGVENVPYSCPGAFEVRFNANSQQEFDRTVNDVFVKSGALFQRVAETSPDHWYVVVFSH